MAMAHVILFEHANFHGAHKHVFDLEPDLNAADDKSFNDKSFDDITSSIVILEGKWTFFEDPNFQGFNKTLGPGIYPNVTKVGIGNDKISSLTPEFSVIGGGSG
jgi:hypothetical protein